MKIHNSSIRTSRSPPSFLELPSEKRFTVMIIDDDEISLSFYQLILKRSGYRVISAKNGLLALAVLKAELVCPSLILVDCMMPEMDGETFLRNLKNELPNILRDSKVVGLTSFDSQAPQFKRLKDLACDCRQKPWSVDDLLRIVSDYLASSRTNEYNQGFSSKNHNQRLKALSVER